MPIDPDRISHDIEVIAGFSETTPDVGYSRPTFSPAWRAARDYVIDQVKAAGCKIRVDAAGNLHARPEAVDWNDRVWLSGSHIDSVPSGGKFDGVVGVICTLEAVRSAHAAGRVLPLEMIVFAEEEGTTFGIGMIGSRLWVNSEASFAGIGDDEFFNQFRDRDGQTYFEAGEADGVRRADLPMDRLNPSRYRGLIEIHIEQGPALWARDVPLAVVTAIAGRRQYKGEYSGAPSHAGTTPMPFRSDPLVAAAHVISGVDEMARKFGPSLVATVGRIDCQPNAVNVIPGAVRFTVDVRSPRAELLETFDEQLRKLVINAARTDFNFMLTEDQPPVQMNAELCAALRRAAGGAIPTTTSGALHDAAIIAPVLPTAMLFVASKDGISHHPAEFSRIEDIAAAATALSNLVALP